MKTSTCLLFALVLASPVLAAPPEHNGDVTDVRVVRKFEQHPGSSLIWEPYIAEWKPKHLVVG